MDLQLNVEGVQYIVGIQMAGLRMCQVILYPGEVGACCPEVKVNAFDSLDEGRLARGVIQSSYGRA